MHISSKRYFLLLALLLIAANASFSANENHYDDFSRKTDYYVHFKNISSKDGLSSNFVLNILQDKYGVMWFATNNGLTRYDGNFFTVYLHRKESEHSISDNLVTSLAEDKYGNLWVGTGNGLNRYNRQTNSFVRYVAGGTVDGLQSNYIRGLYADKDGFLWVESKGGFLSRLDVQTETWTHVTHSGPDFEGTHYYHPMFEDSSGNLWIGGRNLHPKKVPDKNIIHIIDHISNDLDGGDTRFFVETTSGELLSAIKNRLHRYNPQKNLFELLMYLNFDARSAAISDKNGKIRIGGNDGIMQIDTDAREITSIRNNVFDANSLISNEVYCIYQDKNNCIWIGTDKGISLYSDGLNIFRHYKYMPGTENGLASNNITTLMQDNDGLLWVGTDEHGVDTVSLNRELFGNFSYSLLRHDLDIQTFEREKEVLRQYFRHEVIQAANPSVTEDYVFNNYRNFRRTPLTFKQVNENSVSALYQDSDGRVYIGLWAGIGFNTYDKSRKEMKRYALWSRPHDNKYPFFFEGNPFGANWYSGFLEDDAGNFWCATWETFGLNLFNREEGRFESKHYMPLNRPKGSIYKLVYDAERNRMWMCGALGYYGYYDFNTRTFTRYAGGLPKNYINREIFEQYYAYCDVKTVDIALDFTVVDFLCTHDDIWLAANENSIVRHTVSTDKFEIIVRTQNNKHPKVAKSRNLSVILATTENKLNRIHTENNKTELVCKTDDDILSLHEMSDGILWIGTKKNLLFYNTEKDEFATASLKLQSVSSILEDNENQCAYVTFAEGLAKLKDREIVERYIFDYPNKNGLPGTKINQLYLGNDNILWICTDKGLVQLDTRTNQMRVFRHEPDNRFGLLHNYVHTVCEDGNADLWVTTNKGLCVLNRATGHFTDWSMPDDRTLTSRLTSCIMQDNSGKIWIGATVNGISVLNPETDRFNHYIHQTWDEEGISDNDICCIFQATNEDIWVGTRNGLNKYNPKNDAFIRVPAFEDYRVMNVQEDTEGNLWISTNKGLFCLHPSGDMLREITNFPGLQDAEFSKAGCRLQNGDLAFGGNYGFNVFNPKLLLADFVPKPIVFSRFVVGDSVRCFDLSEMSEIKLKYRENSFSVDFSSVDYEFGEMLQYRYKLKGFEDNWTYVQPSSLTAKYTNIPFGKYTFIVEASNCFGEWKDVTNELTLHIATPWYRQWWFYVLSLLSVVAGVFLIIRFRENQLKQNNLRLEKMVEQRTVELKNSNEKLAASEKELRDMNDAKNRFFGIISHDLRNPLKALNITTHSLYEQYDHLKDEEKLNILRVIHETTSQTGDLLENLLMWVVSQMNMLKPNFQKVNLSSEVQSNIAFLQLTAQKKQINLLNRVPEDYCVSADTNLLSTILRNLLSNAIHYSFARSDVIVSAEETDEEIVVSVTDFGVGISEENLKRLFNLGAKIQTKGTDNEQGTGLGLVITREFVYLLGGEIKVKSSLNKGSTFIFALKKIECP